jgi:hypothetical protein
MVMWISLGTIGVDVDQPQNGQAPDPQPPSGRCGRASRHGEHDLIGAVSEDRLRRVDDVVLLERDLLRGVLEDALGHHQDVMLNQRQRRRGVGVRTVGDREARAGFVRGERHRVRGVPMSRVRGSEDVVLRQAQGVRDVPVEAV